MEKLPKKLSKEPLIDAVFEMRFSSEFPASDILPGFLFGKLDGNKKVETLPSSQFPKKLRDSDPSLQFAPLVRLEWDLYNINVSDRSIVIGCKLPYPGWIEFRKIILHIVKLIKEVSIFKSIDRYSLKYVDLLDGDEFGSNISILNSNVYIAGVQVENQVFSLRVDVPKDNFLNIINVASHALVILPDGSTKSGVIVDVDTIYETNGRLFDAFSCEDFEAKLEEIHISCKSMFFDCLKDSTVQSLGPIYE